MLSAETPTCQVGVSRASRRARSRGVVPSRHTPAEAEEERNLNRLTWLYIACAALTVATASGRPGTGDGLAMLNVARSMAGRGSLEASPCEPQTAGNHCVPGIGGRLYAGFGLLPSAIAVPPLVIAESLGPRLGRDGSILAGLLVSVTTALVGALVPVVLVYWLVSLGLLFRTASLTALLVFFGSVLWYESSKGFYSEPYYALGLTLAACLISTTSSERGAAGAGAAFGAAISCRVIGIVFAPAFALYVLLLPLAPLGDRIKRLVWFGIGALPFIVGIAISNYVRFGDVTRTGYHLAYPTPAVLFSTPLVEGIGHLLFDGEVGLIWFTPWIVLLPWAWIACWRRRRPECVLSMVVLAEALVFFGKYKAWHGGWAYGPRMLAPCLPLAAPVIGCLVEGVRHRAAARVLVLALAAASLAIQIGGAIYPMARYYQLQAYWSLRHEPSPYGDSLIRAEWQDLPSLVAPHPAPASGSDSYLGQLDNPINLRAPDLFLWKAAAMGVPRAVAMGIALALLATAAVALRTALGAP